MENRDCCYSAAELIWLYLNAHLHFHSPSAQNEYAGLETVAEIDFCYSTVSVLTWLAYIQLESV